MTTLRSSQLGLTGRLARFSATHRWYMILGWTVLVIVGAGLASGIGDVLTTEASVTNNPESEQAKTLLEDRLRGPAAPEEFVVIQSARLTVDDAPFAALVGEILADVRALEGTVLPATSFYETGSESLVSADRRATLIPVTLTGPLAKAADTAGPLVGLIEDVEAPEGVAVLVAGQGSIGVRITEIAERDLQQGEAIGLPVAILILLVVSGRRWPLASPSSSRWSRSSLRSACPFSWGRPSISRSSS